MTIFQESLFSDFPPVEIRLTSSNVKKVASSSFVSNEVLVEKSNDLFSWDGCSPFDLHIVFQKIVAFCIAHERVTVGKFLSPLTSNVRNISCNFEGQLIIRYVSSFSPDERLIVVYGHLLDSYSWYLFGCK